MPTWHSDTQRRLSRLLSCGQRAPGVSLKGMDNRGVASACATSFAVGVIVGFSLNRWLRAALKRLEGGL
jgi:hypothetical protein